MTITEASSIIGSAVAIVGITLAVTKFWMSRIDQRLTRLVSATREDLLKAIGCNIGKQFAAVDPRTYVTLDYRMDGDTHCLYIPLDKSRVTECLQGMRLQLVEHSLTETEYSISTRGFSTPVRLHWHYHDEMECIQIVRGHVTDVGTGLRYGPGEIWIIEPGVRHIADFDNAYCLATVRPPLKYASEQPINLDGISAVYESPPPKP